MRVALSAGKPPAVHAVRYSLRGEETGARQESAL
jgi:hypothetical protein